MVMDDQAVANHHRRRGGRTVIPENKSFLQRVAERQGTAVTEPREPAPTLNDIAAPTTSSGSVGTAAYVQAAIEGETAKLAAMAPKSGRNHQLNRSAFSLRRLIDNGSVAEQTVYEALFAAANACGIVAEDGEAQCKASIESGFKGSTRKVGAKPIPDMPMPQQVTEVSADDFLATVTPISNVETKQDASPLVTMFDAEESEFWQSRESLTQIYNGALARMCAPWAVLAHCAARALYIVRPTATLPPLIGGPGSLNWFGILVAPSGAGKSAAEDVARELVDIPIEQRSLGSGEGFLESYMKPADKETGEPAGQYESLMFICDESDTISALNSRTGSTLLSTLRTAFTGKTISFGYRGRTNQKLSTHGYRATLVMAVQPTRAGWILSDAGGGTPQRFNWFPGIDRRISLEAWSGDPLTPIVLPSWREWEYDKRLTVPDAARDMVLQAKVKGSRGEQDALDGHALFCREKFAYSLTVLDGRSQMTDEDWRLSGIAARISSQTRAWVAASVASDSYTEAEERGRLMGVSSAASDDEKAHRAAGRTKRIGGLVLDKLKGGPMSEPDLRRSFTSRDRPWLPNTIQALSASGLIACDDQKRWMRPPG